MKKHVRSRMLFSCAAVTPSARDGDCRWWSSVLTIHSESRDTTTPPDMAPEARARAIGAWAAILPRGAQRKAGGGTGDGGGRAGNGENGGRGGGNEE